MQPNKNLQTAETNKKAKANARIFVCLYLPDHARCSACNPAPSLAENRH